jgi:hypothetical protein
MWLAHSLEDEVGCGYPITLKMKLKYISLVVYVNFIAACQVHCIVDLHWKLCH